MAFLNAGYKEKEIYWFHPDHLSSSSYITGADGEVTQNIEYFPSGETFVENHRNSNYSPYKFNGKELDAETGYYYYGARYYNPRVSLWLNVDPLADYNPFYNSEHYIDGEHNGGVYNSGNNNPYIYTYNSPIAWIDPNGKQVFAVHGTWSDPSTWKNKRGIENATYRSFGNKEFNFGFKWSGANYSGGRSVAAKQLVKYILNHRSKNSSEPITLVGHSHGGNVDIEALNIMVKMPEFKGVKFNLLTINTPVRDDYQLSKEAQARVNHINVYDGSDPVQSNGGYGAADVSNYSQLFDGVNKPIASDKLSGEYGNAGRTFKNATNIEVNESQGATGDFHNSHNRIWSWFHKLPKQNEK
ncbi:RHS repeat domain-containing protein [Chryseobacterium carnipullorum]|uniref:RHS repeat domain-containing protein n=1 Tax=Chryseobacterium carnipullorum TaxID=1124835 RepID=UPI000E85B3A2|nr:RHS repeat-associated core domain-containing protein [Chryseobacterium carnipullorum]HBV17308.1 hypothetical protein [Chryseobacterium carnipullorum]